MTWKRTIMSVLQSLVPWFPWSNHVCNSSVPCASVSLPALPNARCLLFRACETSQVQKAARRARGPYQGRAGVSVCLRGFQGSQRSTNLQPTRVFLGETPPYFIRSGCLQTLPRDGLFILVSS